MFIVLLRQKESLLRRLLPVSQRQLDIVRSENAEDLLSHLGRKSKLLDELEMIEQQLEPFKNIPPEQRVWINEEERTEARCIIEHCNELLKQIIQLDTQSTEEHTAQKNETEGELKRSRQAAQVHKAYVSPLQGKHFERSG